MTSKEEFLQYQKPITHKNIEQKRSPRIESSGAPDKKSSMELIKEFFLVPCLRFDK